MSNNVDSDPNFYLNQDNNDVLEWEDLAPYYLQRDHYDYDTPEPKFWKGAYWTVKWRISQVEIRGYVGINKCSLLPDDWMLKYKYSMALIPAADYAEPSSIKCTEIATHTFAKPKVEYEDHSTVSLPSSNFISYNPNIYLTPDSHIILKCRLEAIPIPFGTRHGYDSKKATGMVGLENLGATCYLNALLQMLYHVNSFRRGVYDLPFENEVIQQSTTLALQSVFNRLQMDHFAVSTRDLTKAFGWNTYEAFQQQDVQEMMRILLDKLEERMKGTPADGTIQRLFVGKIKSYIRCMNIDYESSREEDFYDLQLDVKGCKNIYESFSRYVAKETLNGDNQYDAGDNRGKQDAEKGVLFVQLPPVLTIHLKRFEFDMQRMGFAKIHDRFEFPLRLVLDEFIQPRERATAEGDKDSDACEEEEAPPVQNIYHLHSVLVHSGDVSGGHYTAFIRPSSDTFWQMENKDSADFPYGGKWYKFDDDCVTPANRREAVEMCYGSGYTHGNITRVADYSSAYMLVYIREAEAPQVMQQIDIPKELSQRLGEENMKKTEESLHQKHRESFFDVDYFLESDLHDFSRYSESEDLLSEKYSVKHLKVLLNCTYLGLIYHMAHYYQRLPCEIEIWKAYRKDDGRTRIYDPITSQDYMNQLNPRESCYYFIRFVDENDLNIRQEAQELLKLESRWLCAVRNKYLSNLPPALKLTYDPCEGCSIGQGGHIIKNFAVAAAAGGEPNISHHIDVDDDENNSQDDYGLNLDVNTITRRHLVEIYHKLCHRASHALMKSESYIEDGSMMILFRAYDLEEHWQTLGIERLASLSELKKLQNGEVSDSSVDTSDSENELNYDSTLITHKTRRIIYLGCMKMSPNQQYKHIELQFQHLLMNFFENYQLQIPPNWKLIQFVNVYSNSDVVTYPYTPLKQLKDMEIQSGDILYCFPLSDVDLLDEEEDEEEEEEDEEEITEDEETTETAEKKKEKKDKKDRKGTRCGDSTVIMNKYFQSNEYVHDIKEYFENETTQVNVNVRPHKYFPYPDTLNRESGIWKYSGCPYGEFLPDGKIISLSKKKLCGDIIQQVEGHFGFLNENRLIIGKSYLPQAGGQGFRQLRNYLKDKTLYDFISMNMKTIKYLLHLVALPFPIKDRLIHNLRYFEFQLCDKKLINLREKWLSEVIYIQASERYREQITQLIEENPHLTINSISRIHLYPVSYSLIWPDNVNPLPDEWIFEDKIYLKTENSKDHTIADLIQQIKDDIYGPQEMHPKSSGTAGTSGGTAGPLIPPKRRLSEVASGSGESDVEDIEVEGDEDEEVSRKRSKNEYITTKQYISRGEFPPPPGNENNRDEQSQGDIEESNNPFLFDDSPWGGLIHLTELVDLNGSIENNWGGPYAIVFEIEDYKVGSIFHRNLPIPNIPQSWLEYFYEERPYHSYQSLGVQLFSSEEWIFITGAGSLRYGIRSIPISVYSYELSVMEIAQGVTHETKPFLTYLREDDTTETFTARIIQHTEENDWQRISLISRTIRPYSLPEMSTPQRDHNKRIEMSNENDEKTDSWNTHCDDDLDVVNNTKDDEIVEKRPVVSQLWQLFERIYPDYTSGHPTNKSIPLVGLQRSSSRYHQPSESQTRFRKQSGIKIRG